MELKSHRTGHVERGHLGWWDAGEEVLRSRVNKSTAGHQHPLQICQTERRASLSHINTPAPINICSTGLMSDLRSRSWPMNPSHRAVNCDAYVSRVFLMICAGLLQSEQTRSTYKYMSALVTQEHKTSLKGAFGETEMCASSE